MATCRHGIPTAWCAVCNHSCIPHEAFHGKRDDEIRVKIRPPIKGGIIPRFERPVRYPSNGIGSVGTRGSAQMRAAAQAAGKRATYAPITEWGRQSVQDITRSRF